MPHCKLEGNHDAYYLCSAAERAAKRSPGMREEDTVTPVVTVPEMLMVPSSVSPPAEPSSSPPQPAAPRDATIIGIAR